MAILLMKTDPYILLQVSSLCMGCSRAYLLLSELFAEKYHLAYLLLFLPLVLLVYDTFV